MAWGFLRHSFCRVAMGGQDVYFCMKRAAVRMKVHECDMCLSDQNTE